MEAHIPESLNENRRDSHAWDLFLSGRKRDAAAVAAELARRGYMPAHMLLGLIYEHGGGGIDADLDRAISSYRQLAYSIPCATSYVYVARACMKAGGDRNEALASSSLMEAKKYGWSGELYLASAANHERRGELIDAIKCNLLAACYGRILGMTRASAISWKSGRLIAAVLIKLTQFFLGPALLLIRGKRALDDF